VPQITRGGVALHYLDVGQGPPIFFHTGGGGDGTMWQSAGYLDALPGRRYILFDHRGHGRSGKPHDLKAHAMDEYVADVIAVLDAAGVERCAVIGYSDGARLLYRLATRHPDRVTAVVGIGGVDHPDDDSAAWRRGLGREIRATGLQTWLESMSGGESEPAPQWLMDNLASTTTEMFVLEVEAWAEDPDECADFPHISAPTLIVCGESENTDGASELAMQALPDGEMAVMPGFGHLQAFWRSDVTGPIIARFLARV